MKKTFTIVKVMIAAIALFAVSSMQAADQCSKVVDVMCNAFQQMADEANKCTSLEQLTTLDFDSVATNVNADDIPDSCLQYKLNASDKKRLKASIDNFSNSLVNKMYDLSGGIISKQYIQQQMDVEMSKFKKAVDNAVTFEDFVNNVSVVSND